MQPERVPAERVAAIYDIHGNLPALEAVLAEIKQIAPDCIVVGGDVAAGPCPREAIERLQALAESGAHVHLLRGNADREIVNYFDPRERVAQSYEAHIERTLQWTTQQITPLQRDFLAGFVANVVIAIVGLGPTRFCHGSPRSDEEIITRVTSEERLSRILADVAEPVIICGHTHVQFDRRVGQQRVANAGSVGMPYEGRPGAYWALLGPEVSLKRTDYDFERAAALVRESAFPDAESFANQNILNPPRADEATAFFERIAIEREGAS
jgi:predicted phosphodiesterase